MIDGTDIVYRDYYDISVAVGTPKGLVVPVLRGVNHMSFAQARASEPWTLSAQKQTHRRDLNPKSESLSA